MRFFRRRGRDWIQEAELLGNVLIDIVKDARRSFATDVATDISFSDPAGSHCLIATLSGLYMHWTARLLFQRGDDEMRVAVGRVAVTRLAHQFAGTHDQQFYDQIDNIELTLFRVVQVAKDGSIPGAGENISSDLLLWIRPLLDELCRCAHLKSEVSLSDSDFLTYMKAFSDPVVKFELGKYVNSACLAYLRSMR